MTHGEHKELILVVRTAAQLARTMAQVRVRVPEAEILGLAISETEPVPVGPVPVGVSMVVFTSAQGMRGPHELGLSAQTPVWCVGDMTAAAARQAGWLAVEMAGEDAAALVETVRAAEAGTGTVLWHIRAENADIAWQEALRARGVRVMDTVGYRTRFAEALPEPVAQRLHEAGAAKRWRSTILMSRKSAEHLLALLERARIEPKGAAVVISEAVAERVAHRFDAVRSAVRPTLDCVIAQLMADWTTKTEDNPHR